MADFAAIQDALGIAQIAEGIITMTDGGQRAVLKVGSVNYALLPPQERVRMIERWGVVLKGLTFTIDTVQQATRGDVARHTAILRRQAETSTVTRDHNVMLRELASYLDGLSETAQLLDRVSYVVVHADPREPLDLDDPEAVLRAGLRAFRRRDAPEQDVLAVRSRLEQRRRDLELGFATGCGLPVERVGDEELAVALARGLFGEAASSQPLAGVADRLGIGTQSRVRVATPAIVPPPGAGPGPRVALRPPSPPPWGLLSRLRARFRGRMAPAPDRRTLDDADDLLAIARAERTIADLVAPDVIDASHPRHLRVDTTYLQLLEVADFPNYVQPGWLWALCTFPEPLVVRQRIAPLNRTAMIRYLHRRNNSLLATLRLRARQGEPDETLTSAAQQQTAGLLRDLELGHEGMHQTAITIAVPAPDEEELARKVRRVRQTAGHSELRLRIPDMQQLEAFFSTLIVGRDELRRFHPVNTAALATTFPFIASAISMPEGILFGYNPQSRSVILFDPFADRLLNYNLAVMAPPGSGKSYFLKNIGHRALATGTIGLFVIDPEGEYGPFAAAVGADFINISYGSAHAINPLALPLFRDADDIVADDAEAAREPVSEAITFAKGFLRLALHHGTDDFKRCESTLDRALLAAYLHAGIDPDDAATWRRTPPLLGDVHAALLALADSDPPRRELAASLARDLESYVGGGTNARLFNRQTTLALDPRHPPRVVFGLRDIVEDEHLTALALMAITNHVWGQVRARRLERNHILAIDESWALIRHPTAGESIARTARRGRKYGLALWTATQNVADYLDSPVGQTILDATEMRLVLRQAGTNLERCTRHFALNGSEAELLARANAGEGLFFALGYRMHIQVIAANLEHRMATTKRSEVAAIAAERRAASGATGVAVGGAR